MLERLTKIFCCVALGFVVAIVMYVITFFAYWPPRWNFFSLELAWSTGLLGALYVALIPLIVLGLVTLRRTPGTLLSVSMTSSWLVLTLLLRKPWMYYGEFPWPILMRDFVQPLPVALAVGLAFAISAGTIIGANFQFQQTPNGAAESAH
jgi:hypothetical protein